MPIQRVFVAGAGLMGHGIAQVHAAIGKDVTLYEPELSRAQAGKDRIAANLDRAVSKGRLEQGARDDTLGHIAATDDRTKVCDAELVIEAVFEDLDVKRELWRELDELAPEATIFASNTSSISIDTLAGAVSPGRKGRFAGMHFFSPVPVMPLVELVLGHATTTETENAIRELAAELGKELIVSADRPGFLVNRILMPFLAEAMRAFEEGTGTIEDIDTGARIGLNHPMGPFELADFIGLDVTLNVMRVQAEGLGAAYMAPPKVLVDLVEAGHLGQKTGKGFYTYPREPRPKR
ncbi:MAG TPA: 3-hydroxyacyl-CoA dehydrogenase NAD-binding domain-containing protein [Candidatus Limnocylindrales bacterium]|nr:3-hydroxyacyl-CoA dehydrogenase NAD-binding domain-containing protein [Candidatus Limnocylindrales bacterium]